VIVLITIEFSSYLEKIRHEKGITQEEFVSGIISMRQYQRYKKGFSEISYDKIDKFAEKLGTTTRKLLSEYKRELRQEIHQITLMYNAIANRNIKLYQKLQSEISRNHIISEEARKLYDYTLLTEQYFSDKLSRQDALTKFCELIEFPQILDKKNLTDIEVLILSFLINILPNNDQDKIIAKLNKLFEEAGSIITGEGDYIYSLILLKLARINGIKRDHEKVLFYCNMGISRGVERKCYYLWDYFYYYMSLSYYAKEMQSEYEETLVKCYNVLNMEGNKCKIGKFTALIEKDFNIDFKDFVIRVISKVDLRLKENI